VKLDSLRGVSLNESPHFWPEVIPCDATCKGWHTFVLQMNSGAHITDKKQCSQLTVFKKLTMMIGKCYPTILCNTISLKDLFLFLLHLFVAGRQHAFFCFISFRPFGGLKVCFVVDFCIFNVFSHLNTQEFFLCHSFAPLS